MAANSAKLKHSLAPGANMIRAVLSTFALSLFVSSPALADTDLFTISGPDSTVIQLTASSSFEGFEPVPSFGDYSFYVLSGSGSYDGTLGYTFGFYVLEGGLHDYDYVVPPGGIFPPYYSLALTSPISFLSETVTCIPDPYANPPCAYFYNYSFVPGTYTGSVTPDGLIPPIPSAYLPYLSGPWSLTITPLDTAATPEPSSILLLGSGLITAGVARLRRTRL